MRRMLLPAAVLLMAMGCQDPQVVPTRHTPSFKLTMLRNEPLAVWPIATADLDESAGGTVVAEYSDQGKFLDAVSLKISNRLLAIAKPNSIGSDKVIAALAKDEGDRALLDPTTILGTQDPNNRFAKNELNLARLSGHALLSGVRFLLLPREISIGRHWGRGGLGGWGFGSTGYTGGTFDGGAEASARTGARFRFAVIDLASKTVVWDGSVFASASSMFRKATALHQVEDDLVENVLKEVQGL